MSWQMGAVAALMRATRHRRFADPAGGAAMLARPKGSAEPPARLRRRVAVRTDDVGGFAVHRLRRHGLGDADTLPVLVYLHGGAYVSEIVGQHWGLLADAAETLDVEVRVPIYGLAPQHHALEALDLVTAVLDDVAAQGRACHLAGDSAGGGLALTAALHWAHPGRDLLRGLSLVAPWLDLVMDNPGIDEVERRDPWLHRAALHEVARVWADGVPLDDPRVSPVRGDLAGLPPVDLWVGTRDITLPDSRLLRDRLVAAGGEVRLHEEPGAIHVHPLLPVPEGRRARRALLAGVGRRLDAARAEGPAGTGR